MKIFNRSSWKSLDITIMLIMLSIVWIPSGSIFSKLILTVIVLMLFKVLFGK